MHDFTIGAADAGANTYFRYLFVNGQLITLNTADSEYAYFSDAHSTLNEQN